MTDKRCLICREPGLVVAVGKLRQDGLSLQAVADRVKRSKASINRHVKHTESPAAQRLRSKRNNASFQAKQNGRCGACGVSVENPEPSSLLKRAERLMFHAETIVTKALEDEDYRLMLQAIDRARSSMELVMRAVGMLRTDAVRVSVDARRLCVPVEQLTDAELEAIVSGKPFAIEGFPQRSPPPL